MTNPLPHLHPGLTLGLFGLAATLATMMIAGISHELGAPPGIVMGIAVSFGRLAGICIYGGLIWAAVAGIRKVWDKLTSKN